MLRTFISKMVYKINVQLNAKIMTATKIENNSKHTRTLKMYLQYGPMKKKN